MAFDPAIAGMGPDAFELRRNALPNRWGGPVGYRFIVSFILTVIGTYVAS